MKVLVCLLVICVANVLAAPRKSCDRVCNMQYDPYCAVNSNGNQLTISNACAYNVHVCKHPNEGWHIIHAGECASATTASCNNACPYNYVPVCGVDRNGNQQTFGNNCGYESYACEHKSEGWRLFSTGECPPATCNKACTLNYSPVCGINSANTRSTFGNQCAYESYACEHPTEGWQVLSTGECP